MQPFGLNLDKLHDQGYYGCSTMAGKDNGIQARIRNTYPKAVFVDCSSHRLNLVDHGLNSVADVRNTIGTVKSIITFFRDSPKRRRLVPNIPDGAQSTKASASFQRTVVISMHNWSNWRQTSMSHRVRVRGVQQEPQCSLSV